MIKNIIPRIIATILILSIILSFAACDKGQNTQTNGGADMPKVVYEFALTYAAHGIGDQNALITNSLNLNKMSESAIQHLPIFKFENLSEFEDFKNTILSEYDLSATHNDVPSLNDATKNYDQTHFNKNTVFLIAIPATSGSLRHKVDNIDVSNGQFLVSIKDDAPISATMDLVRWFIVVSVDKSYISNCTSFDAVLE